MRVYIAAPWTHRQKLPAIAATVTALGCTVTHDWWNREAGDEDHSELSRLARLDFNGVVTADTFVLLNFDKSEGKSVESGIALACGKHCIGVGPRYTNIFHNLPAWDWVETVEDLYLKLNP